MFNILKMKWFNSVRSNGRGFSREWIREEGNSIWYPVRSSKHLPRHPILSPPLSLLPNNNKTNGHWEKRKQ